MVYLLFAANFMQTLQSSNIIKVVGTNLESSVLEINAFEVKTIETEGMINRSSNQCKVRLSNLNFLANIVSNAINHSLCYVLQRICFSSFA